MTKNPVQPALPTPVKRRGRPPRPGGPTPQAVTQRAYRARLKKDGKTYTLASVLALRDRLELREQDVTRLEARNADLEGKLSLQGQYHSDALKEIELLKQDVVRLRRQMAGKKIKVVESEALLPSWKKANDDLRARNAVLEDQIKKLKDNPILDAQTLGAWKKAVADLEAQLSGARKEIRNLKSRPRA